MIVSPQRTDTLMGEIYELMLGRITKILGICDRERSRLLSMGSLFFLPMVGWAFGCAGRDALFVKQAGPDKLPYMYIINACLMAVIAALYARAMDRIARYRFLILQLLGSGMLLLVLSAMIPLELIWMPYAVFSLSEVTMLVLVMHFWTVANDVFDPREGKRIFPLIGGFGLVGTILGGVFTKQVVGIIGTANLFAAWAVLLGMTIPISLWAHQAAIRSGVMAAQNPTEDDHGEAGGLLQILPYVWEVRLLRTLTYLSVPMWLVIYVVDFQFLTAMNEVFAEQDQLSAFLGAFNSVSSLSALVLQLFVAGRVLRRFGVGTMVVAHPIGMTFGSIALVVRSISPVSLTPRLFSFRALSGAFAKFSDNVVFYSIGESASQLLYSALPEERRGQGRAFISGAVEPLCTALAGGVLILFTTVSALIHFIPSITVGVSVLWILVALRIKSDYLRALVKSLSSRDLDLSGSAMLQLSQVRDAGNTSILLEAVSSSNDEVALLALEMLQGIEEEGLIGKLCELLPEVRPNTQIAILSLLSELEDHNVVSAIHPLLQSPRPDVRAAAVRAIGQLGDRNGLDRLGFFMHDPDLQVRTEAVIALLGGNADPRHRVRAVEVFQDMVHHSDASIRAKAAYIIGEVRDHQWLPILLDLAAFDDDRMAYEVIKAMVTIADPQVVPALVRFLGVERLVPHASDALMKLGDPVLEPLHQPLVGDAADFVGTNGTDEVTLKTNIISCLGQLRRPVSIPVLTNQLEGQPESIREAAIDALAKIKMALTEVEEDREEEGIAAYFPPELLRTISSMLATLVQEMWKERAYVHSLQQVHNGKATLLLIDALNRSGQQNEERALTYLQLLSEPNTIRAVATNLRRAEARAKAEAIEALEESCPEARELVRVLEAKYFPTDGDPPQMQLVEVLRGLLREEKRTWLRACLIYVIGELHVSELKSDLWELRNNEHLLLNNNVHLALRKIGIEGDRDIDETEVDQMAITMERILFLRSVSLFADVDGSELQWIADIVQEKTYSAGEIVFEENDPGDALYIIARGSARILKGGAGQVVLAILQAGDFFGEMALLDQEPRSASVEVQQDATMLMIAREDFQRLLLARPHIAFALLRNLNRRLREMNTKLLQSQA